MQRRPRKLSEQCGVCRWAEATHARPCRGPGTFRKELLRLRNRTLAQTLSMRQLEAGLEVVFAS